MTPPDEITALIAALSLFALFTWLYFSLRSGKRTASGDEKQRLRQAAEEAQQRRERAQAAREAGCAHTDARIEPYGGTAFCNDCGAHE